LKEFRARGNAPSLDFAPHVYSIKVDFERAGGNKLRFEHIADEEDHHAGVDFVFGGPKKGVGRGHIEIRERVLPGNEDDDEDEL